MASFYDKLSKHAAEKESFLVHYIDCNIEHISMILLKLYQSHHLEEKQKKELLNVMQWMIWNYWHIYEYRKKIRRDTHLDEILDHPLKFGYEFNELSLRNELKEVINIIVSIANSFLHKQETGYGSEPMYIIEHAAYLCILTGSTEIYDDFLAKMKNKFWEEYCSKFPHNEGLLFRNLLQIDPSHLRLSSHGRSFKDKLLSELREDDIKNFVIKLMDDLKEASADSQV